MACKCLRCEILGVLADRFPKGIGAEEANTCLQALAKVSGVVLAPATDATLVLYQRLVGAERGVAREELASIKPPVH